ncbi:hypothetical protein ACFQX4_05200 [Roseomonas sp. GCM10028921]
MAATIDLEQRKRFSAFGITEEDLALLRGQARFARERLPALLTDLHSAFAGGAATAEITRSVQHAADGTECVSALMDGILEDAAGTSSVAGQITGTAEELASQSGALGRAVEDFLLKVRAA